MNSTRHPLLMTAEERAAELAELDARRAQLHAAASTSNPTAPPAPNNPGMGEKKYADMTPSEQAEWKRKQGLR